jgi:ribose/xylose/arabinose/galactoside ABC-type transport system permease subunit
MNAFERLYEGIGIILAKVGYFLATLATLYLSVGLACLLGFIVGGMLGYFSFDDFVGWLLWYVFPLPLGWWILVGGLYTLIVLFIGSIGATYELLTRRNVKGVLDRLGDL